MNRTKVSLPILLPWEKAMAYCRGSTIQIYYSPHSLSDKKKLPPNCRLVEHLRTTACQGKKSQSKDLAMESFGRERKRLLERSNSEMSLLRNLCHGGSGETLDYKREPRARDTERKGVPLWNDWNALRGKALYWPSCLICMSKAASAIQKHTALGKILWQTKCPKPCRCFPPLFSGQVDCMKVHAFQHASVKKNWK